MASNLRINSKRLAIIESEVRENTPDQHWIKVEVDAPAPPEPKPEHIRQGLEDRMLLSGHNLIQGRKFIHCTRCRLKKSIPNTHKWATTPCAGTRPSGEQPTPSLTRALDANSTQPNPVWEWKSMTAQQKRKHLEQTRKTQRKQRRQNDVATAQAHLDISQQWKFHPSQPASTEQLTTTLSSNTAASTQPDPDFNWKAMSPQQKRQHLEHARETERKHRRQANDKPPQAQLDIAQQGHEPPNQLGFLPDEQTRQLTFSPHESHTAFFCGGYLACERCGAMATIRGKAAKLLNPCRPTAKTCATMSMGAATRLTSPTEDPTMSKGAASRIKRLLEGLVPRPTRDTTWPDGSENPIPKRLRPGLSPFANLPNNTVYSPL